MIENTNIIPLPPVDWGDGVKKDVVLLEITSPEGITGLGSAYTGVDQLRDALRHYQQDPETLHKADAEMTIPMSAIDIALWDIRGIQGRSKCASRRWFGVNPIDREALGFAPIDVRPPLTRGVV